MAIRQCGRRSFATCQALQRLIVGRCAAATAAAAAASVGHVSEDGTEKYQQTTKTASAAAVGRHADSGYAARSAYPLSIQKLYSTRTDNKSDKVSIKYHTLFSI